MFCLNPNLPLLKKKFDIFLLSSLKRLKNYFDDSKHIYGLRTILGREEVLFFLLKIISLQFKPLIISPGVCFSKAPETFRARKAMFNLFVSKN